MELDFVSKIIQNCLQKDQSQSMHSKNSWEQYYQDHQAEFSASCDKNFQKIFQTTIFPFLPQGSIVDLGAGAGAEAIWLAKQGFRVLALDFAQSAMQRLAAIAQQKKLDLTTIVGDVTDCQKNISPAKIDFVYACYLHLPAKKRKCLWKQVYHYLKLEGFFLYLGVHSPQDNPEYFASLQDIANQFDRHWNILLAKNQVAEVVTGDKESFSADIVVVLAKKVC